MEDSRWRGSPEQIDLGTADGRGVVAALAVEQITALVELIDLSDLVRRGLKHMSKGLALHARASGICSRRNCSSEYNLLA